MHFLGYGDNIVAYIDDFVCVGRTAEECLEVQAALHRVITRLGFTINVKKTMTEPAQTIEWLGLMVCSQTMMEKQNFMQCQ